MIETRGEGGKRREKRGKRKIKPLNAAGTER